ncbi:hypothetical protein ACQ5SP_06240 [Rhodovulum sp. YNF3179]
MTDGIGIFLAALAGILLLADYLLFDLVGVRFILGTLTDIIEFLAFWR